MMNEKMIQVPIEMVETYRGWADVLHQMAISSKHSGADQFIVLRDGADAILREAAQPGPADDEEVRYRKLEALGWQLQDCKICGESASAYVRPVVADLRKDAELGRVAMRFVDRAGDVHPGIDDAERICAEFYAAMSEVLDKTA